MSSDSRDFGEFEEVDLNSPFDSAVFVSHDAGQIGLVVQTQEEEGDDLETATWSVFEPVEALRLAGDLVRSAAQCVVYRLRHR